MRELVARLLPRMQAVEMQGTWRWTLGGMKRPVLLFLSLGLAGCAAVTGYPDQPDSLPTTIASLDQKTLGERIVEYNKSDTSAERKKAIRNEIIFSNISQIDQDFNTFKVNLNRQGNVLSIGTDFVSLALAGLGATIGNSATKAALAAASAGVIGAKAAIDKDVLYQKTITALITEMDAQRSQVFARIITNMNSDVTTYPLEFSSKDIQDYFQAGTLVSAIAGITQSAGAKAQDASAQVANALSARYNYNDLSKKIESYWGWDGKSFNKDNDKKLKDCMADKKLGYSVPYLINGASDADKRTVTSCLGI